jgi:transferrin binding protein
MAARASISASITLLGALTACGGGGGGGGGVAPAEVPFTSFAAIVPNQPVLMDGTATSITARGTQTTAANGDVRITAASLDIPDSGTMRLMYDGARSLSTISLTANGGTSAASSVSFDRSAGHTISCSSGLCLAANPSASGIVIDALAVGWNYQSFGVWKMDPTPASWVTGAVSAGTAFGSTTLPATGSATFTGLAAGFFFDAAGTPFRTSANMSAIVNFGTRNLTFATTNTRLVNINNGLQLADSGLNLFSPAPISLNTGGINFFSGTVHTANGQLVGNGHGRFYGPNAEEIGGVYALSAAGTPPPNVSRMVGGFGGRRQ